jgi:uncharacterized membrane protein
MCPLAAILIGLSFIFDSKRREQQRKVGAQALIITALAAAGLVIFWLLIQYIDF